ncbi:Gfo/Idh/MocA family protein [Telmatobacter bradus]|uniref:Gfo/Idh/MocA family protein n=1 Tax=Telmatobacter bradus TaxID=474953 RepID=UPI003B4280CF
MNVGIIGTGAIAGKHAVAYKNIGYTITACTNRTESTGRNFALEQGAEFVATVEEVAARADVDFLDVCTFPAYRLEAVELAAKYGKHVLVQKPMAIDLATAEAMIRTAHKAGIQLGVVSQHRWDDSTLFLKKAIADGRLGKILQADAYVKWYRSPEYYARPIKGSWAVEGGGALINQAVHQVDVLLYLLGPAAEVFGFWQKGALHKIESEDCLSALVRYGSGASGVLQASTALWPGYPERIEIHGTKGSAIVTGDQLTAWDVQDDAGEAAPVASLSKSGAADPLAISTVPFERQLAEFGAACKAGRAPACSGLEGYRALQLVRGVYQSCAEGVKVMLAEPTFA